MMTKIDQYREVLKRLPDWDAYLLQESGLPGPRGNIELAQAVATIGDDTCFRRWLQNNPQVAPTNHPGEFLAFCGVLGLGELLAAGRSDVLKELRNFANDPRWRLREAVAMALQRWGDSNLSSLIDEMDIWAQGNLLERRAAMAALCEPRLLEKESTTRRVLALLNRITASLIQEKDRKSEPFRILRKALAYGWSVAVVANPTDGKPLMEKWLIEPDRDIHWLMLENIKKNRLIRMDANWADYWRK